MSDRLAVVLWWFIELYSWSRFFLRTDKRTNEGNPRGPRGPKKKRNGGKGKDENNSRQRVRQTDSHRVFCQGWQISIITVQAFRVMKICTGRDFRNIGDQAINLGNQALSKIFWMHFYRREAVSRLYEMRLDPYKQANVILIPTAHCIVIILKLFHAPTIK